MAQWLAHHPERRVTPILQSPRRIIFKNVPEWATISDMICLVHGGAIERIWSEKEEEVIVQFLDDTTCKKYYETYSKGIRIGEHVIEVEQATCDPVSQKLKNVVNAGNTRVVYVDIPALRTIGELEEVAKGFEVDHIVYRVEPNKASPQPLLAIIPPARDA